MLKLPPVLNKPAQLGLRGVVEGYALTRAWRAGMLGPERPSRTVAVFRALDRLGPIGGAIAIAGIKHADRIGLIDELGSLTFGELDARSDALACALRARGAGEGDTIGIRAATIAAFSTSPSPSPSWADGRCT